MTPRVIRSDRAEEDLVEILAYLRERSDRAADRFEHAFLEQIETLARFPMIGRSREELAPRLRSLAIKPYILYFRPLEDGIELVRILHGSRDVAGLFDDP